MKQVKELAYGDTFRFNSNTYMKIRIPKWISEGRDVYPDDCLGVNLSTYDLAFFRGIAPVQSATVVNYEYSFEVGV